MKTKKIKIKIDSTFKYIQLFNGIFNLTDTEIEVLSEFVHAQAALKKAGIRVSPFSTEIKKQVAEKLGRDDFNTLNNYIKKLKDKGAISLKNGDYSINPLLLPQGEQEITFTLLR